MIKIICGEGQTLPSAADSITQHLANEYVKLANIDDNSSGDGPDTLTTDILQTQLLDCMAENVSVTDDGKPRLSVEKDTMSKSFKYFKTMFDINMREANQETINIFDVCTVDFIHALQHTSATNKSTLETCPLCHCHGNYMLLRLICTTVYLQNDLVYQAAVKELCDNLNLHNCVQAMAHGMTYTELGLYNKAARFALYFSDLLLGDQSHGSLHTQHLLQELVANLPESYTSRVNPDLPLALAIKQIFSPMDLTIQLHTEGLSGHTIYILTQPDQKVVMKSLLTKLKNHRGDRFVGSHICAFEHRIYLTGGELGLGRGTWNKDIYEIDTVQRSITSIGNLPQPRRHHKSCCSNKHLYIAGGFDKFRQKRYEVFKLTLPFPGSNAEKELQHIELPTVDYCVDAILVTDNDEQLVIRTGEAMRVLDISEGWKVISDNDFKGSFPTYKSPTDNDIQTSTSEFSVQAIWYPDFNLPKD